MLGKEAALYMPSGTMSNLVGMRTHCSHGDEVICEENCHVLFYEQAGYAQLNGMAARMVPGEYGVIQLDQIEGLIRSDDQHFARTRLVLLENTHNRGGGRIQPYETVEAICGWAHENGLSTHLDGARLMNAAVASGIDADRWAQHFDTVSICFSKGLGAPVGSALVGSRELIAKAHRHRKLFGGGMRQAGVIAAAALHALENNVQRLAQDHANARRLAEGIQAIDGLSLDPEVVDTNILFFKVDPTLGTAAEFSARLAEEGMLTLPLDATRVRAVTHLSVDANDMERAIEILAKAAGGSPGS
jgi:threonine aldolase